MQALQSFDPGGVISVVWIDLVNFTQLANLSFGSSHEPETLTTIYDTYNYTPSSSVSSSARLETSRRLAARRRCPSHGHNHPISNNFHSNTSLIMS